MSGCLQRARLPGFMHRMPIHDQLDRADDLFEWPLRERCKQGRGPLLMRARIMLHPKRRSVARTIRGLSCRGIARIRDVLAASVSLEVAPHRQE
jgi:hypothetical protein